jgi:hypothetical protein
MHKFRFFNLNLRAWYHIWHHGQRFGSNVALEINKSAILLDINRRLI